MRTLTIFGLIASFALTIPAQERDRDFSGIWRLNAARSDIRSRFDIPINALRIRQTATLMTVFARAREGEATTDMVYPLNGKPQRSEAGGLTFSIATKWEGTALLTSVIVGGHGDYTLSERWERSRDGNRLTLTRSIEGRGTSVESTLEYDNPEQEITLKTPAASPLPSSSWRSESAPVPPVSSPRPEGLKLSPGDPAEYMLAPGTRILLRLTNAVNTKHTAVGDRIYLQTAAPVFLQGRMIIPPGSYVTGTVTESERAGRVKGKSGLNFRFDTLTLPNGVSRDFHSRAGSVDMQGNLDRSEGKITGEGTKGKDAATVAKTTAAGTGIGTLVGAAAGHLGMGMGIGAAAGALGGLAGVLGSRGQDVVIPQGTSMEMVLDRELRFTDSEIFGRVR